MSGAVRIGRPVSGAVRVGRPVSVESTGGIFQNRMIRESSNYALVQFMIQIERQQTVALQIADMIVGATLSQTAPGCWW